MYVYGCVVCRGETSVEIDQMVDDALLVDVTNASQDVVCCRYQDVGAKIWNMIWHQDVVDQNRNLITEDLVDVFLSDGVACLSGEEEFYVLARTRE